MINLLKIDYDGPRLALRTLRARARIVHRTIVAIEDRRSPSGVGWHRVVAVTPPPRSPAETVFLQLLFGSDPVREAFNWHRAALVAAGQVSGFWAARYNTLYCTSHGRGRRANQASER